MRKVMLILFVLALMASWLAPNGNVMARSSLKSVRLVVLELPKEEVLDLSKPLKRMANAKIEIPEIGVSVRSDSFGEAQVELPVGYYTFVITSPGNDHFRTEIQESVLEYGTGTIGFPVSPKHGLKYDNRPGSRRRNPSPARPGVTSTPSGSTTQSVDTEAIVGPTSVPIEPSIPSTIIFWSTDLGQSVSLAVEDYVQDVIAKEVTPGFYRPKLNSTQELAMYESLAVVARSYATFHTYSYACAPTNPDGRKIDDTTWCQVIDPIWHQTHTSDVTRQARNNTTSRIAIKIVNFQLGYFDYADTVFFASDDGQTTNSEDYCPGGPGTCWYYQSYLRSVADDYDPEISSWICSTKGDCPRGVFGHEVGFSQDGNAGYALHGYSYSWIAPHYFSGLSIYVGFPS